MNYGQRPQPPRVLLSQAKCGHLVCTRDHNLNPTFRANVILNEADRQVILRYVLDGVLAYEARGPYNFGVGRLLLTARGQALFDSLPQPAAKVPKAGAR